MRILRRPRVGREVAPASNGSGPLLERDYWGVLGDCSLSAPEVAAVLAERFAEFGPRERVRFRRAPGASGPLEVGEDLEVAIIPVGTFGVRVIHRDANSVTVATLAGHPEAGRITFGVYRNGDGDLVFHVRSRARSSSRSRYVGFLAAGDPMQTDTWCSFISRLAATVGEGVDGFIHASKRQVQDTPADGPDPRAPTFIARGD
jgi:hypothetical protein